MVEYEALKYEISKPKVDIWGGCQNYTPGLKIELTSDKSLIEFQHFYYAEIEDEVTQIVGIKPDEIDKVIDVLKDIKTKLKIMGL
jgi:hypothetical protein